MDMNTDEIAESVGEEDWPLDNNSLRPVPYLGRPCCDERCTTEGKWLGHHRNCVNRAGSGCRCCSWDGGKEIEITEDMITAGFRVIMDWDQDFETPMDAARDVFIAMTHAAHVSTRDGETP